MLVQCAIPASTCACTPTRFIYINYCLRGAAITIFLSHWCKQPHFSLPSETTFVFRRKLHKGIDSIVSVFFLSHVSSLTVFLVLYFLLFFFWSAFFVFSLLFCFFRAAAAAACRTKKRACSSLPCGMTAPPT